MDLLRAFIRIIRIPDDDVVDILQTAFFHAQLEPECGPVALKGRHNSAKELHQLKSVFKSKE
jgi:hypothetical protein